MCHRNCTDLYLSCHFTVTFVYHFKLEYNLRGQIVYWEMLTNIKLQVVNILLYFNDFFKDANNARVV